MPGPSPFRTLKTSPEIIRLAVMLYVRFPLSLQNAEDLLYERRHSRADLDRFPRQTARAVDAALQAQTGTADVHLGPCLGVPPTSRRSAAIGAAMPTCRPAPVRSRSDVVILWPEARSG